MSPTEQRLKAIDQFVTQIDLSLVECVLLTGSMVFGRNYSVTDESDIDFIFVVDPVKIGDIKATEPFGQINIRDDLIDAFSAKRIDRFWLDYLIDGVKLNIGLWDVHFLDAFLSLQASVHRLGTLNPALQTVAAVDAYGRPHPYTPELEQYKSIFIKQFPLEVAGVRLSSPAYCNLIASEVLHDPQGIWEPRLQDCIRKLNANYGNTWFDNFLAYVIQKSSPEYLAELRQQVGIKD